MSGGARVVYLGADHAGLELKNSLKAMLEELGHTVHDLGTHTPARVDYPDFARRVSEAVLGESGSLGVLVCGTGLGISMAANRHAGVRAAVCHDTFSARMSRMHNDANILCMGSRVVGAGLAGDILEAFLAGSFEGGRHTARVAKIELPSGTGA